MPGEAAAAHCHSGGTAQVRLGMKHRGIAPVSGALAHLSGRCWGCGESPHHHTGIDVASWALPRPCRPEEGARTHTPCRGRVETEAQRLRGSEHLAVQDRPSPHPLQPHLCRKPWLPLVLSGDNRVKKRQCGLTLGLSMGGSGEREHPHTNQSRCRASFVHRVGAALRGWGVCVCDRGGAGSCYCPS